MSAAQTMVGAVADAVEDAIGAGIDGVHIYISIPLTMESGAADGAVLRKHIVVEGFRCINPTCDKPTHVRLYEPMQSDAVEWPLEEAQRA